MNQLATRLWTVFLTLSLLLSLAACGKDTTATTMHLKRTEGTVTVSDGAEKDVPLLENLGLYSGYGVDTRSESYAWISLDDVKLTKMDQESGITIQKEGKGLEIEIISGSLFFNVTQPLEDDETMGIRTSTMLIGIRGTCGWVEDRDGLSRVYVLEGTVECSAENQTVQVNAGEMAELMADGTLVVQPFTVQDITAFVKDDLVQDLDLCSDIYDASGLDVLETIDGEGEDTVQNFGDEILNALVNAKDGDVITLDKDHETQITTEVDINGIDIYGGSEDNPVVLDLNGHTLTLAETYSFTVYGALRICDNSTGGGMLNSEFPFTLDDSAYLFLDSGTISCAVLVLKGNSTFIINGGTINNGGSTYDNSTITMYGGTLFINHSFSITNNSTFNMYGGTIGTVKTWDASTFTMNDGTIDSVWAADDSTFNMYGGTINTHTSIENDSTFNMYDGTIGMINSNFDVGVSSTSGDSTFNMYGGTINTDVVTENDSNFTQNGGTINGQVYTNRYRRP